MIIKIKNDFKFNQFNLIMIIGFHGLGAKIYIKNKNNFKKR